jgi:methylated-DNA-protein-cysteine methyltransferase related protein
MPLRVSERRSVTIAEHATGPPDRRSADPRPGSYAATIISRVRAIPRGLVCTYGDIDPHAPRAVGRVLATDYANVPWHRVVRADGTAAMGLRQLERLRNEGVPLRGDRVDFALARTRWDEHRARTARTS